VIEGLTLHLMLWLLEKLVYICLNNADLLEEIKRRKVDLFHQQYKSYRSVWWKNLVSAISVLGVGRLGVFFFLKHLVYSRQGKISLFTQNSSYCEHRHFKVVALSFGMLFMERIACWHETKRRTVRSR